MLGRYIEYTLQNSTENSIALAQTVTATVTNPTRKLILNGNFGNRGDNAANFYNNGFSYYISLTSTADLSAINFTITGFSNGSLISETIVGPNAVLITTTNIFDFVTSITASADVVNNVSVGNTFLAGKAVYSIPISIDFPNIKDINCLVYVNESVVNPLSDVAYIADYNIYASLKPISQDYKKSVSNMLNNELILLTELTSNTPYYNITQPFRYIVLEVTLPYPVVFSGTILCFSQSN